MKKILLLFTILIIASNISFTQNRKIARGAMSGELYLTNIWYMTYIDQMFTDTIRKAIFHVTENGKKLTIQYDGDVWNEPLDTLLFYQNFIVADATPGTLYNVRDYDKNDVRSTTLFISFDYGKHWKSIEDNYGRQYYYAANTEGLIYRASFEGFVIGTYVSNDYGTNFTKVNNDCIFANEPGLDIAEFFTNTHDYPFTQYELWHTYDVFQTKTVIPIDDQYVNGTLWGDNPIICRGSLKNEVYLGSLFSSDKKYRVSFSADTGHTFRHVFISDDVYLPISDNYSTLMTDREPGVFYIIKLYSILEYNLRYLKVCIEYYRDYGETLVATYCHDLHKNYGKTCEAVNDLVSEKCGNSCVLLTWCEPESSLPVEEYWVYRRGEGRIKNYELRIMNYEIIESRMEGEYELLGVTKGTAFLDENLPAGEYAYYVVAHYEMGCVADSSNHVKVEIEVGIKEKGEGAGDEVLVYPNPTTGELTIDNGQLSINNVEVFDVYGRKVFEQKSRKAEEQNDNSPPIYWRGGREADGVVFNISHLNNGIYFVRVGFENGGSVKKLVKQ